jgi:ankyrin repeat protein
MWAVFDHKGGTALTWASCFGYVEVVKLLLALPGIDYNHQENEVVFDVNTMKNV